MYMLHCFGTIWYGPFDTYWEAERASHEFLCPCGCGDPDCYYEFLEVGTI